MKKLILLLLIAGLLIFYSCDNAPEEQPEPETKPWFMVDREISADFMGMCHISRRVNNTNFDFDTHEMRMLSEMNVTWALHDLSWGFIQPTGPNDWNFDHDYIRPVVINAYNHGKKFFANMVYDVGWIHNSALNGGIYGPSWTYITEEGRFQSPGSGRRIWEEQVPLYVNYVVETVREFHNYVGAWGIWNEPCNRPRFWTASDEDFIYLTWQTVKGIRELEEELIREGHRTAEQQRIQIVIGGLSPLATPGFIRGLLDVEPELRALADGISYHPYSSSSVTTALVFESFRNTVEPFGFADKIWLTEVGYPTGGAYPSVVHPNFKASEVIKTLTELAIRGAVNAIWYHFMDDRTPATQDVANSEHWFGLVLNPCYTPKTGAPAFAMWGRKIPGSRHEPNFPISSNLPSAFRYHYFRGQNDEHYLIIWRDFPVPANVTITLPGTNQRVYITDARTWPTDWNDAGPNTPLTIPNSRELGETSSHSVGPLAQFFVWENNDPTARPTISGN